MEINSRTNNVQEQVIGREILEASTVARSQERNEETIKDMTQEKNENARKIAGE